MFQNFSLAQKLRSAWHQEKSLFFILISSMLVLFYGSNNNNEFKAFPINLLNSNPGIAKLPSAHDQTDFTSVDAAVKAIYQTISFRKGEEPNWNRFRALFSPDAPLIRITPEGVIKMDIEGFILSFSERIRKGVIRSFNEAEISRKTDAFGGIAQVFSIYVKNINPDDSESSVRGINCIQLYSDGQRWWISSLVWEDERPDNRIPQKYLR